MTRSRTASTRSPTNAELLARWEKSFRAAAKADQFKLLRNHLQRIELPDEPQLLLEGTISVVRACVAYASMDNAKAQFREILNMQSYDSAESITGRYAVTFDIFGKSYARVITGSQMYPPIDFADLYGHPWNDYKICGFNECRISFCDECELFTKSGMAYLEKTITEDIRSDYDESEVDLFMVPGNFKETYLRVMFQQHEKQPARRKNPRKR